MCARSSVDRVFDSDSKDRGFESRRARQKPVKIAVLTGFFVVYQRFLHDETNSDSFMLFVFLPISAHSALVWFKWGTKRGTARWGYRLCPWKTVGSQSPKKSRPPGLSHRADGVFSSDVFSGRYITSRPPRCPPPPRRRTPACIGCSSRRTAACRREWSPGNRTA